MNTKLTTLLQLADPALPIGGFNHSGGLETFVQQGVVDNAGRLKEYVAVQLEQNWAYNDGAYVSLAYDAAQAGDFERLAEIDRHAVAAKAPREIREASLKLGVRLLKIFARRETAAIVQRFQTGMAQQEAHGCYPVAFGLIAAVLQQNKADTLAAFYYNAAAGAVTNGVKLIPLSQMDGQDILFDLHEPIARAVAASLNPDPEWLGAACAAADIRAMQHERLYTRLYMS